MIKRLTVTVHTRERTVVRPLSAASLVRCPVCNADVPVLSAEFAASILEVSTSAVRRLIEGGMLHLATTGQADGRICGNSLSHLPAQRTKGGDLT